MPNSSPTNPPKPKGPGKAHGKGGGISKRPGRPTTDVNGKTSRGRPPALTKAVHDAIIYNVAELAMVETRACQAEGFDPSLAGKWKVRGAEALAKWAELTPKERTREMPYVHFFEALRDAHPKFIKANLKIIKGAADRGDWRAADRRLEMADRATYGKRVLVGSDPKHPLPTTPILGGILILPDNRRMQPTEPQQPKEPNGSNSGTKGI